MTTTTGDRHSVGQAHLPGQSAENPPLAAPASHPADWAFYFSWLPHQPSAYGPLWAVPTWPIARLAETSVVAQVLGYRALARMGYVMCWWLSCTGEHDDPSRRARAVLLAALANSRLSPVAATTGTPSNLSAAAVLSTLSIQRTQVGLLCILSSTALAAAAYAPFWQGPQALLPAPAHTTRVVSAPSSLLIAASVEAGTSPCLLC